MVTDGEIAMFKERAVKERIRQSKQIEFEKFCDRRDRESIAYDADRIARGGVTPADLLTVVSTCSE
jgi:hypothetical protein